MLLLLLILLLLAPASIPRKILLLDDHWRIKYLSYRSRKLGYGDVQELRRRHLFGALLDWRSWPCRILHWSVLRKGLHLRLERGGSYFLRTRNDLELIEELEQRRPANPTAGG